MRDPRVFRPSAPAVVLVRLELRRLAPIVARVAAFAVAVVAFFLATGRGSQENMVGVVVGTGFGFVLAGPLLMMRDKFEGTLAVVRNLPVSAGTIAGAKLTAAALAVIPVALQATLFTARLATPGQGSLFGPLVTTFFVGWGVASCATWFLLGTLARFEPEQMSVLPVAALGLGIVVVGPLSKRVLPDPVASLRWFFGQPWALSAVGTGLTLIGLGVAALAFHLARRGIDRYTSPRLRVDVVR